MAIVKSSTIRREYPWQYDATYNGNPISHSVGEHVVNKVGTVYLGDSPQDWRTRVRIGSDATSELIGDTYRHRQQPVQYQAAGRRFYTGYVWTRTGGIDPYLEWTVDSGLIAQERAANNAAASLNSSYRSAVQGFASLTFLAELREALIFLSNPVKGLFKQTMHFAKQVKNIRYLANNAPERYAEKLGHLWIGYKYGVDPLIRDGLSASATVQTMLSDFGKQYKVKISGSGFSQLEGYLPSKVRGIDSCAYALQDLSHVLTSQVRYKGYVFPDLGSMPVALNYLGLDPGDVVPAVWEGIPWSFLVDGFTNISDVLYRGSRGAVATNLAYCLKGVKNTSTITGSSIRFNSDHSDVKDGYVVGSCGGGAFFSERVRVHRSSISELPPVTFQFEVPSFNLGLNLAGLAAIINEGKPRRLTTVGRNPSD